MAILFLFLFLLHIVFGKVKAPGVSFSLLSLPLS